MRYTPGRPTAYLELTRRNLTTLLAKLDNPDSKRTLISPAGFFDPVIVVTAVEDTEHYADRAPGEVLLDGVVQ